MSLCALYRKIIYDKLDKIVKSGASIVLSRLPIGDLATQYFADRDIFCAGRVPADDLERVEKATGAVMQTSLADLSSAILGECEAFEEKQIGPDRYNLFTGCSKAKTATMILRGGSDQYIAETERSLHDALMIVKRAVVHSSVVGGGGAIEMQISKALRQYARTISTKLQMIVMAYAKALEIIPRLLAENAGFDSTAIVNQLRAKHAKSGEESCWYGVDIENEGIINTLDTFVWEPTLVKQQALSAATEAACMILSVDETVRHPQSEGLNDDRPVPAPRR
jgi:T-complex protein 1 subunit eta